MIKGKLSDGYEYEISEDARDDWEIIEAINELEEHPERIATIAKKLLGDKGYKDLKEACRVNGRVKLSDMSEKIFEILSSCGETKN